ncbi:TPA: type II toxin-antitoxin system RelE/ParE family toxin [Streptococcus equi subsp. equi]|nr:type II toxin-antitoxin system RelE/ParE family toxin [Streptococcus equi subsp. equi]HEK9757287.1 type II toxin-antitoxin system RelE/ParE family toxin [Streptococcus equi subsp. equi]HEK9761202.1 type II toxin-antitoxin system RelE/ParE family toxin [Streptococcus equi subsp. equi]HEK9763205.1 type II toxin-antitoxin system RelE/ParE family toxin [Streptococcus equi subsp. equi]HEK9769043.1 type II toxin-antitoxin system RelE/ParE family toxin [Streptococcus equi subsp. equi]
MRYKVLFTKKAKKQFKKLDRSTAKQLYQWIMTNLDGTDNPRRYGKALQANRTGEWRYRLGNYRILAEIIDDEVVIEVFKIEHRSSVYKIKR